MRFTLEHVAGLGELSSLEPFAAASPDLVRALLEEAGRFVAEVIAPLQRVGDEHGSVLTDGAVVTPPGFKEAYRRFVEAGWPAAAFPEEWGGGGMPFTVGLAIQEMVTTGDIAFSLCPMLTYSANEMLLAHGSDEQRATYLEKLVTGEWTGTMVLTEPHAGSDVGALSTRAVPADDGTWRITGQKIFITWGDHDVADNIVHIVLARTPGAPPGTKGISTFIVPKYLVNPDGTPGEPNDITTVSLEHKLGIHASPTCVLSFGEDDGAVGYLVGEEHQGMAYMFTMMNNARLQVGVEGLAVAERAYQHAAAYARERRQGRAVGAPRDASSLIVEHPDVRRMLMLMRSQTEAMRAVMYRNAAAIDLAKHHPDEARREHEEQVAAILTPVSKAWGTDLGVDMASLDVQVHGGMGFIEETGAAQLLRDSRIAPIYEGTNGIQAIDLVLRKLPLDGGDAIRRLTGEMRTIADSLNAENKVIGERLGEALDALEKATEHLLAAEPNDALAGATPYLEMLGITLGGWLLGKAAAVAGDAPEGFSSGFCQDKQATARFYAHHVLSTVPGLLGTVTAGAGTIFSLDTEAL
jgi:alkylation response protein AidB-like acyl-CoA dehydrogenase